MGRENAHKEERRGGLPGGRVEGVIQNTAKKSSVIVMTPYPLAIATSFGLVVGVENCLWGIDKTREVKLENSGYRQLLNVG